MHISDLYTKDLLSKYFPLIILKPVVGVTNTKGILLWQPPACPTAIFNFRNFLSESPANNEEKPLIFKIYMYISESRDNSRYCRLSMYNWHRRFAKWWFYSKNNNFPKHFFTRTAFMLSYNGLVFHRTMQRRNHVFTTNVFIQNKYYCRISPLSQSFFHQIFLPKTPFVFRKIVRQYHKDLFAFLKCGFNFTTSVRSHIKLSIWYT